MGNAADDRLSERTRPQQRPPSVFPLYLMKWGDEFEHMQFVPLQEAARIFDTGWTRVDTGGLVLLEDFTVRKMTPEEGRRISRLADEYSESK